MCGITGIFDRQNRSGVSTALIQRMTTRLSRRGPDGEGVYVNPPIALGHRRLSIIDLVGGAQPMASLCGNHILTFNGEIYNFQDLKVELEALGAQFKTHSDSEVLLQGYNYWGVDCVKRFRGMFAFAIWDVKRRCLVLARDRFGKKPLHYAELPNGLFLFASEIKSILTHEAVSRAYRDDAVEDYFALGYVPDPKTIFKDIHKLPAAHVMEVFEGRKPAISFPYWDVDFESDASSSLPELEEELISTLKEAVRLRMIADVPLGAFLSGGVDSSTIVALMSELSDEPVKTCSISFDETSLDESEYAEKIAARFGTDHFTKEVAVNDFALLDELADVFDEPFADASALPTYRVSELARSKVTVALSGDGGDEILVGYRRQRMHMGEEHFRDLLPLALRKPFFGALGRLYPKLDWAPRGFRAKSTFQSLALGSADAYFNSVSISTPGERAILFSKGFQKTLAGYSAAQLFQNIATSAPSDDALSFIQYLDIKTNLVGDILTKTDRASMAHGLEVRAPFLDHVFVEWAARLPMRMKLQGGQGKYILKKAMEAQLPQDVLYRPKMGFVTPISQWFRGPLRARIMNVLKSPVLLDSGYFDPEHLEKLGKEHISGNRDHGRLLWSLFIFDACMKTHLGARESHAA
ncbi:MAG: amidotransferase 1, exosortase A system-associated [Sphingomonadales bacterium]|jgi:asparagine synthase (glutamine-hydrolysing)